MASFTELILTPPPAVTLADLDAVPALRAAFARGPVTASPLRGEAWWFGRFGIDPAGDLPAAAFRGAERDAATWRLCADPVHLRIVGDAVVLDADAVADLGFDEARGLAERLGRHFAEDGLAFETVTPREWLLHGPAPFEALTRPLADAQARSIEPLMPEGPDARTLKRIMNEAQMLLHETPENQAREARGAAPVNGLWLWGGSSARPLPTRIEGLCLASDSTHRRGLAEAAGGIARPLALDALEEAGASRVLWIDLDAYPAAPEAWLDPLRAWLERLATRPGRSIASLRLTHGTLSAPLFARDLFARLRRGGVARAVRDAGWDDSQAMETAS